MSDSLQPHELQHTSLPCPSPTPGAHSNSCPSSQWCHSTILSSVALFSFCLQSFPPSESFPIIQLFTSGGQNIEDSASALVLPMNIQGWFPLGLTGLISLLSKGFSIALCKFKINLRLDIFIDWKTITIILLVNTFITSHIYYFFFVVKTFRI